MLLDNSEISSLICIYHDYLSHDTTSDIPIHHSSRIMQIIQLGSSI